MKKNIIKIAIVFAVATSGTLFISCGNTTSSQSQTQTQVQEQTIAAAPKIFAVFLVIIIGGLGGL